MLEPDLKDGHGGLRDVQSLWWAAHAGLALPGGDVAALDECYDDAGAGPGRAAPRHRPAGRRAAPRGPGRGGRRGRGTPTADALMADVAAAARTIAWIADEAWGRFERPLGGEPERVAPGVIRRRRRDRAERQRRPGDRSDARAPRRPGCRPTRQSASSAARSTGSPTRSPPWPPTWPAGAADKLVALLLEGHAAVPVLEALDQRGLLARLLPEWEPVRSRPQRNAYHRFTVDRHLWEAAANAAELVDRVARPDLLVLGALFHDIGKGYPGDHTEAGMELVRGLGHRLGLGLADTDVLVAMVEHHLLLPDVAVRRDLTDPATIRTSPTASARSRCSTCCTPSPRPTRRRPVRRRGGRGRRGSSPTS